MRKIIKTDGEEIELRYPITIKEAAKAIRADTLDVVILKSLGKPLHVMLVDDNGWETRMDTDVIDGNVTHTLVPVKALKPINAKATELYLANCRKGTTHQIAGDVLICHDEDFL